MKFQQLRYLCAIADCDFNISKAAGLLHVSQPGISKQIQLLEAELNTSIFVRRAGRIVSVSERGAQVLVVARRIIKDAKSLCYMGDEFSQAESGQLTVATLHIHSRYLLLDVVTDFRKSHPQVRIDLLQGTPGMVCDLVMSGEADIGITIERIAPLNELLEIVCWPVSRSVIVPANHPLALIDKPSFKAIAQYPIIAVCPSLSIDWSIRRSFQASGVELNVAMYACDATVMKAYVEAGVGIAVMPSAAYEAGRDTRLRAINVDHLFGQSDLRLIIDPCRYLRSFAYDFIEQVAPGWNRKRLRARLRLGDKRAVRQAAHKTHR